MKLFHLSDLHLGKRLNEFPLLEDQRHILWQILKMIDDETPDALLICGDVYDRPTPPVEAVTLLDDFLWEVSRRDLPTLIVSGNHDSPERLAFGSRLMERSRIYISRTFELGAEPVVLDDEHGSVCFHLLPFVKPVHLRAALAKDYPQEAEDVHDYTDAVRVAIAHMKVNVDERNVLLAHQFVTGAKTSGSEGPSVGGLDNVDVGVFDSFDYVALGHLHGPQRVGRKEVRYSGTPLKYSFDEMRQRKSITVVEIGAKGNLSLHLLPLAPLHDLRELRGSYDELMLKDNYEGTATDDYLSVILTDEDDIPNALERLRNVYSNVMVLAYDNQRTSSSKVLKDVEHVKSLSPLELFSEFYEQQNNHPLDEERREMARVSIERVWEAQS